MNRGAAVANIKEMENEAEAAQFTTGDAVVPEYQVQMAASRSRTSSAIS
jgi:hypothetical protein